MAHLSHATLSICIIFGSLRISLAKATDGIDFVPTFTVHFRSRTVLSAVEGNVDVPSGSLNWIRRCF